MFVLEDCGVEGVQHVRVGDSILDAILEAHSIGVGGRLLGDDSQEGTFLG